MSVHGDRICLALQNIPCVTRTPATSPMSHRVSCCAVVVLAGGVGGGVAFLLIVLLVVVLLVRRKRQLGPCNWAYV